MKEYLRYLFSYRWHIGMIAWILMRLSGFLLYLFLGIHLLVIFYYKSNEATFSHLLQWQELFLIKILTSFLIFGLFYHGANGLRLILIEMGAKGQKALFIGAIIASFLLSIIFLSKVWS
jgi:succinate dehydrogenase / fumarate reductase cytochrome b subunit